MKRIFSLMSLFVASIALLSSPAFAGKKDLAWAACIWEQVPTTASNWLNMAPSNKKWDEVQRTTETPPDYAIEWRLQAACFDILKPVNKKWPPSFYGKDVKAALMMTKPNVIGQDKIDPFGFRCDLYFENDAALKNRAGFDWGVRASAGEVVFTTTRFGFAGGKGTVVRLTEGAGIRKCFKVQADGSLKDA